MASDSDPRTADTEATDENKGCIDVNQEKVKILEAKLVDLQLKFEALQHYTKTDVIPGFNKVIMTV